MSYHSSFKFKYPVPDGKFLDKELKPYLEKHPEDKDAQTLANKIARHLIWREGTDCWRMTQISKPEFWRIRKRVAEWRFRNYLDYVTSPESETYWCS